MTIQPHFDDDSLSLILDTLKQAKQNVNSFYFKYNAKEKFLLVDGKGVEGINQTEEYYENIEQNLMFADFNWLTPLCSDLNVSFDAEIDVQPDGEMNHDKVRMNISVPVFDRSGEKSRILSSLMPIFQRLVKFRGYIKEVEFAGTNFMLTKVVFNLEIEGRRIVSLIKNNPGVNHQTLSQWMATLSNVISYNEGRFKYNQVVPVINGRMSTTTFETTLCFKLDLSKRGRKYDNR